MVPSSLQHRITYEIFDTLFLNNNAPKYHKNFTLNSLLRSSSTRLSVQADEEADDNQFIQETLNIDHTEYNLRKSQTDKQCTSSENSSECLSFDLSLEDEGLEYMGGTRESLASLTSMASFTNNEIMKAAKIKKFF